MTTKSQTDNTELGEMKEQLRKSLGLCNDRSCKSRCWSQLNGAMNLLQAKLREQDIKSRIDELTGLVDGEIVKPEYHNLVVGKINELKLKETS